MKMLLLTHALFYRASIMTHWIQFSESQTTILLGIHIMNEQGMRCSPNTLKGLLSKIHHTPNNKILRNTIQLLKSKDLIRSFGKGGGVNLRLSTAGKIHLLDVEAQLARLTSNLQNQL